MGNGYIYDWNANGGTFLSDSTTNNTSVAFAQPGNYNVSATALNPLTGCSSNSYIFPVTVASGTTANFSVNNSTILPNSIINLIDNSTNATTWQWDFGNGYNSNNQNPQTTYSNTGIYTISLITTDSMGCSDTTTKILDIKPGVLVPNVFSPNGDGTNDVFLIPEIGLQDYKVEIYNRWGQILYSGEEGTAAWDGTTPTGEKCPEGTYFLIITGQLSNDKFIYKGTVQLTR